jgi:hypothetical protein
MKPNPIVQFKEKRNIYHIYFQIFLFSFFLSQIISSNAAFACAPVCETDIVLADHPECNDCPTEAAPIEEVSPPSSTTCTPACVPPQVCNNQTPPACVSSVPAETIPGGAPAVTDCPERVQMAVIARNCYCGAHEPGNIVRPAPDNYGAICLNGAIVPNTPNCGETAIVAEPPCKCGSEITPADAAGSFCRNGSIVSAADMNTEALEECKSTCSAAPSASGLKAHLNADRSCGCIDATGSRIRNCSAPRAGGAVTCGEPVTCTASNCGAGGGAALNHSCPEPSTIFSELHITESGEQTEISSDSVLPGSDFYKQCQRWASHPWREMVAADPASPSDKHFNKAYSEIITPFQTAMQGFVAENPPAAAATAASTSTAGPAAAPVPRCRIREDRKTQARTRLSNDMKALRERFSKVRSCWAALQLTTAKRHLDDSEQQRKGQEVKTFDSKISCHDTGPETQDYFPCKAMVDAYNAVQVGHKATEVGMTIQTEVHDSDQMTAATADPNDPTAAMRFQEASIRNQANLAFAKGGIEAALAIVLGGFAGSFPTMEGLVAHCHKKIEGAAPNLGRLEFDKIKDEYMKEWALILNVQTETNTDDVSITNVTVSASSDLCNHTAGTGSLNLLANSRARESAVAQAIDMGMKAVVSEAKGAILLNQADKLAAAIARVRGLDVGVPPLPEDVALLTEACAADPTQQFCSELGFNSDVGFASNNINISGVGRGNSGGAGSGSGSGNGSDTTDGNGKTNRSGVPGSIGSSVTGIDKDNSFADAAGSPGRLKSGGGGPGGGGGGSAGGGGGGGGGGAPQAGGGAAGPINVGKLAYGGGKGALRTTGGGGGASKSAADNKNPFSDLFGKGKAGDKGDLNFRGPAAIGDASGSIFDTISKRYGAVSGDRLLQYEQVK